MKGAGGVGCEGSRIHVLSATSRYLSPHRSSPTSSSPPHSQPRRRHGIPGPWPPPRGVHLKAWVQPSGAATGGEGLTRMRHHISPSSRSLAPVCVSRAEPSPTHQRARAPRSHTPTDRLRRWQGCALCVHKLWPIRACGALVFGTFDDVRYDRGKRTESHHQAHVLQH
jgi:hypothetical protein